MPSSNRKSQSRVGWLAARVDKRVDWRAGTARLPAGCRFTKLPPAGVVRANRPQIRAAGTFTKLQGQYLAFIVAYTKLNRRAPAEADFQRYFEVTPPSVHNMILTLERRGLIRRTPGRSRSVEVVVPLSEVPPLD